MEKETVITAFYKFVDLPNFEEIKAPLLKFCIKQDLKGTILLASEGVNSTISGSRESIDSLYDYLKNDMGIASITYKESKAFFKPFQKMKVRLKKEIVAIGMPEINPKNGVGRYVEPEDWDDFISGDDVVLIDTRNKYETMLGTFEGAEDPGTAYFKQMPELMDHYMDKYKDKKIAMFCTGGIRCEKSTAYLKQKGFDDVYHLNGGIINYYMKTDAKKWNGVCFVFDERVAIDKNLAPSHDVLCSTCNRELNTDEVREGAKVKKTICADCI
jgi:UPF0176 protein